MCEHTLLSAGLLNLCGNSNSDQSVMRLELLQCLGRIVNKGESSSLSTTKLSSETENVDLVFVCLVEFCKLASELFLGDIGAAGVEDITMQLLDLPYDFDVFQSSADPMLGMGLVEITTWGYLHDHLLAAKKWVTNELARSQCDWCFTVRHGDEYVR
jgi:hypothetical protein